MHTGVSVSAYQERLKRYHLDGQQRSGCGDGGCSEKGRRQKWRAQMNFLISCTSTGAKSVGGFKVQLILLNRASER